MARQKLNTASGSPASFAGNFPGSGSRPTQTRVLAVFQRSRSLSMKVMSDFPALLNVVTPAVFNRRMSGQAGVHGRSDPAKRQEQSPWTPAYAGGTAWQRHPHEARARQAVT